MVACNAGDLAGAAQLADEAEDIGMPHVLAAPLPFVRALIALGHGDLDLAEDRGQAALAELHRPRQAWTRLDVVHLLAVVASRQGRDGEAVRVFAAAEAYARSVGVAVETPTSREWQRGEVDRLRSTMPADEFDARWAEGAALSWDELLAYLQRGRGARRRATSGWSSLTPTERQVVDLVATGLTNKDVAARLFMSTATVKSHLTHVFSKLDISTRGQLTAETLRRRALDSDSR
jgi:DNA-binding CsgD family transcriptional regulator